jgi:hypothetical protein
MDYIGDPVETAHHNCERGYKPKQETFFKRFFLEGKIIKENGE